MAITCCTGYTAKTQRPEHNTSCLKTWIVLLWDLTMAKPTPLSCQLQSPWARVPQWGVSSSSCGTQPERSCSCISSWCSTVFNIALPQFPHGGGPRVALHRGVLLGSVALWLLAFPFTAGKSYSRHLLAVCHCSPWCQPGTARTASKLRAYCSRCCFAAREMALGRQVTALFFQLNSCFAGDSLESPRAALAPSENRHRGCPVLECRQKGGKNASQSHTDGVPLTLASF